MKHFLKNQSIDTSKSIKGGTKINENNPAIANSINLQEQLRELKKRTLTFESKQLMDRKVRRMRISDYFSSKSINPLINEDNKAALHKKLKENLEAAQKETPII